MDPFSITGVAASVLALVGVTATVVKRLNDIYGKFNGADLTISLMTSQLSTLKAALEQIVQWMKSALFSVPRYQQLLKDLETSLKGCKVVMALLDKYTQNAEGILGTVEFMWNEDKINEYLSHLNHQTNALTLLLQALQCRSLFDQEVLLAREESVHTITKNKEVTSSLLCLEEVESLTSQQTISTDNEDLTTCDVRFEFDAEIINSGPYRGAIISTMKQVLYSEQKARRRFRSKIFGTKDRNSTHSSAQSLLGSDIAVDQENESNISRPLQNPSLAKVRLSVVGQTNRLPEPKASASAVVAKCSESGYPKPRKSKLFQHALEAPLRHSHKLLTDHKYHELKVLLLGAGDAGKSTLFRQMDFLYQGEFSEHQRIGFKSTIFSIVVGAMRVLLDEMELLNIDSNTHSFIWGKQTLQMSKYDPDWEADHESTMPAKICRAIEILWKNHGIRTAFELSEDHKLRDSAEYFFNSISRLAQPDYIPNTQDVLRCCVRTTGLSDITFTVDRRFNYHLYDCGGARNERKKWVHSFENVAAILFLVDISSYNIPLREDKTVNSLQESLVLFDSIVNSRWFVKSDIFLLFNKTASFEKKLLNIPLQTYFPEYNSVHQYDSTMFIKSCFMRLNKDSRKTVHTYFVDVTSSSQVELVMTDIHETITRSNSMTELL